MVVLFSHVCLLMGHQQRKPMLDANNTMHISMFLSNSSVQSDVPVRQLESVMGCTITNLCLSVFLSYVLCVCGLALILLKRLL